jgi:hypothetical protein
LEHEQLEVTQPTTQEDQIEVEELTTLKEDSLQTLQTLDPFIHTIHIFLKYKEEEKNKRSIDANYCLLLLRSPRCGNALSLLLEFKKEITGGFHHVMVVVGHALGRQVPISVVFEVQLYKD